MPEGGSLINLGELSKPAVVLIEKISDAVGGIAKPWQIKRIARAESQAELIRAESKIQLNEIERRGLERLLVEEGKKQKNIEEITFKALPLLEADARPEEVGSDWLSLFFDRARLVAESEMQSLWAKVLAGESNKPGSFSRQTLEIVGRIDKRDAEMFSKLCSFCWVVDDATVPLILDEKVIFSDSDPMYESTGIKFFNLVQLAAIGLIRVDGLGFTSNTPGARSEASYFGRKVFLSRSLLSSIQNIFRKKKLRVPLGVVLFSRAGLELAKICGAKPIDGFFEYSLRSWNKRKIKAAIAFQ